MRPIDFQPVPTCEIRQPAIEDFAPETEHLPRTLREKAALAAHVRRVLALAALFALLAALEAALLARFSTREPLVVYEEPFSTTLVGETP